VSGLCRIAVAAAALLALPAAAQGRGEVAVGLGVAVGPRTGATLTLAARGNGDAGVLCRVGGFVSAAALSCGATGWFGEHRFAVSELGVWVGRQATVRGPVPVNRLFLSLGAGIIGERDERIRPSYDVGGVLYLARWTDDGWRSEARWSGYGDLRVDWIVDRRE
jgi:hypothetical protein